MITVKINADLLDPKRYFKGAKGNYIDLVLIETPNGQYGDYMVKQSVTKEERLAGVKLPILGNAKNMGGAFGASAGGNRPSAPAPQHAKPAQSFDEDVQF